jgi:hypothetical protein
MNLAFHKIYKLNLRKRDMGNLIGKIALLTLVGAGLVGCATYSPTLPNEPTPNISQIIPQGKPKGIDLRNGFFAESYKTGDLLDLIASIKVGEVLLKKINGVYEATETRTYHTTPSDKWNNIFDRVCFDADNLEPYRFITEEEAWSLFDKTYEEVSRGVQWVEDCDIQ